MSYIYPISTVLSGNIKKNYLMYEITYTSGITTGGGLIDVLIYSDTIQVLFNSALSPGDVVLLTATIATHDPSIDPYPIYTEEYYIKVSESDQQADYLSSSLLSSNNIRYSIINPGADEKFQTFVNTSDGVIGTDVIWSSYYINNLIGSDINFGIARVFYYLSSSISICY